MTKRLHNFKTRYDSVTKCVNTRCTRCGVSILNVNLQSDQRWCSMDKRLGQFFDHAANYTWRPPMWWSKAMMRVGTFFWQRHERKSKR